MWSSSKGPTRLWDLLLHFSIISNFMLSLVSTSNEIWPVERPDGMPNIVSLEVMCGKDHMDVHLSFSHPFEGIVSSKGQHSDPRCIYVPPSSGKTFFSFRISYSRCGTKPDLNGQFYENTVVVQYDKDLLEVWDEAKRLRCEWFNDYEKTASKPPMVIADLDVIQLDFRGDNVDCWMEIQHGKGPWAPPVSGIVPLGSTLTLVVAINDFRGEFDMRVKSCSASDGSGHIIKLSDEYGCVLRPKMISRFLKARAPDERASVITYAFFHAFKFPDALSVHIKCKVEICRHGCLDHCQQSGALGGAGHAQKKIGGHDVLQERKDIVPPVHEEENESNDLLMNESLEEEDEIASDADIFYDDIIHRGNANVGIGFGQSMGLKQPKTPDLPPLRPPQNSDVEDLESLFRNEAASSMADSMKNLHMKKDDRFPHGPRKFEAENRLGAPAVAGPRSLDLEKEVDLKNVRPVYNQNKEQDENNKTRRRRNVVVTDRKARSADVGVSGIYEVISEADLEFSPDTKQEAVTVFQGKISEEVVYGICMPVPGFSVLFIIVISATIVAALVAGSLLYRYQLQKEAMAQQNLTGASPNMMAANTIASWMTLRLFRMRQNGCQQLDQQSPVHETAQ